MLKKLRARDGHQCANPHCRRRLGLHGHHVVFRSKGGPTCLDNLVIVCLRCHGCIHAGILEVYRDEHGRYRWVTKGDGIRLDPKEEAEDLRGMPQVVVVEARAEAAPVGGGGPGAGGLRAAGDEPSAYEPVGPAPVSCFEGPQPETETGTAPAARATTPAEAGGPAAEEPEASGQTSLTGSRVEEVEAAGEARALSAPEGKTGGNEDRASRPAARRLPPIPTRILEDGIGGLKGLGYGKREARERVLARLAEAPGAGRALRDGGALRGLAGLADLARGGGFRPGRCLR